MDHLGLPLPDGLNILFSEVPYVCNDTFTYDDLGMLTYPERVGVDADRLRKGGYSNEELLALGPFLQSWLWFGLLGEAIGVGTRVDRDQRITSMASFVVEGTSGNPLLDTSKLDHFIKLASEKGHAPMFQQYYNERLARCIEMSTRTIDRLCDLLLPRHATSTFKTNNTGNPLLLICLSIQVLAATLLRYSKRLVLQPHLLLSTVSKPSLLPGTRIVDYLLLKAGWPLCQISRFSSDILLRYYVSFIKPPLQLLGHTKCTEKECFGDQTGEEKVEPKHVTPNCDCKSLESPMKDLTGIINADQIPLIRYSSDIMGHKKLLVVSQITIAVEDFVAISHVRSSGLGNTVLNSLPTCQIKRIQGIANSLGSSGAKSTYFWIDTLCVPLERAGGKRALSQARAIFQNAANVIVLEPLLSCYDPVNAQECLLRIKYSAWTSRLWTIQEGALARNLHFQFKTGPRSLDALLSEFQATPTEQRILAWPKPFEQSLQGLVEKLAMFDNDLKLANNLPKIEDYGKGKLRAMLRLGYLSFPKMRIFAEERELMEAEVVIKALEKVYTGLELQGDQGQFELSLFKDKLLQRLRVLAATDLSAREDAWDYERTD
jgi:hypothetical protein